MSEPTQEQAIQAAINRGMAELSMGTVLHYADAKRAFRSVAEHALAAARRPDDESSVIPPIAPALYKCRCKESPAGKCLTCGGAVVPRSFPEAARRPASALTEAQIGYVIQETGTEMNIILSWQEIEIIRMAFAKADEIRAGEP